MVKMQTLFLVVFGLFCFSVEGTHEAVLEQIDIDISVCNAGANFQIKIRTSRSNIGPGIEVGCLKVASMKRLNYDGGAVYYNGDYSHPPGSIADLFSKAIEDDRYQFGKVFYSEEVTFVANEVSCQWGAFVAVERFIPGPGISTLQGCTYSNSRRFMSKYEVSGVYAGESMGQLISRFARL